MDECCKSIRQAKSNLTIELLQSSFDLFVNQLNLTDDIKQKNQILEKILFTLNQLSEQKKILLELIHHELFIIFRDFLLVKHLHEKQSNTSSITDEFFFHICRLFHNLCLNLTHETIHSMKNFFITREFVNEFNSCLNDKYLHDDFFIRSIGLLLLLLKSFRRFHMTKNDYILIESIKCSVFKCLSSNLMIELIRNLKATFLQRLTIQQIFYLDTLPTYLQWYPSEYYNPQDFISILGKFFNEYVQWLINCNSNEYFQCSSKLISLIRHFSAFVIRPIESDILFILSEQFYSFYCQLVTYWTEILSKILSMNNDIPILTRLVIQNLYNLTLHFNVLNFMKGIEDLIPMLLRTIEIDDDEIQLNSYRSLGKLMNEKDIKTMSNPRSIVNIHLEFLRNTMNDPNNQQRFYSLLESLKNFVQHDQVKSEIIEQNGLSLLIQCVLEDHFHEIKVQSISLEILLGLSFNLNAFQLLQNHQTLLEHIRRLSYEKLNQSKVQRAAEGLLWKLVKEEQAIHQSSHRSNQCDIMISYSHKNRQICFQIHELLIRDGFHVWIDQECLRGSTMEGMANAIENSRFVLICMSTSYKQSVYCQSEAHYAFERGCHLVPIIIESNYKPDGWLGIIVSGKIYVDFTTSDFQTAYQALKNEFIGQQSIPVKKNNTMMIENIPARIKDYPSCLIDWNEDDVRGFFMEMKLEKSFLLLCPDMNGNDLFELYQMCLINRESMFQSLKHQLNQQHHTLFQISDYIHFLTRIKSFIPTNQIQSKSKPSYSFTFCNLI